MDEYILHNDDTSDEEEDYKLKETPSQRAETFHATVKTTDETLISFCNYYFGLLIYHAPDVITTYSTSKLKYLNGSEMPVQDTLSNWIMIGIVEAIRNALNNPNHPKASQTLIDLCIEKVSDQITALAIHCVESPRKLIRAIRHGSALPESTITLIQHLNHAIDNFLSNAENYADFRLADFELPHRTTPENLLAIPGIRAILEARHSHNLIEINAMHNWALALGKPLLTDGGVLSSSQAAKKKLRTINVEALSPTQSYYFSKLLALNCPTATAQFLKQIKDTLLLQRLQEIINQEEAKGAQSILQQGTIMPDKDIAQSTFSDFAGHLDIFTHWNAIRFHAAMVAKKTDIFIGFISQLKATYSSTFEPFVFRQTLPTLFVHHVNSAIEHIASLRLTNRSIARMSKNQLPLSMLGTGKEENVDMGWKFPVSETHFGQERTRVTTNGARSGQVPIQTGSNAYTDLSNEINTIKIPLVTQNGTFSIADRDIANWTRQVLQCKTIEWRLLATPTVDIFLYPKQKQDLMMFIVKLAHLLGGTECMRYPGALIQVQMMLDLIIAEELFWENALKISPTYFPMIISGAVEIARTLTTIYAKFSTPLTYNYPGNGSPSASSTELNQFISADAQLSAKWFDFFKRSKQPKAIENLPAALEEAIPEWFPGLTIKQK